MYYTIAIPLEERTNDIAEIYVICSQDMTAFLKQGYELDHSFPPRSFCSPISNGNALIFNQRLVAIAVEQGANLAALSGDGVMWLYRATERKKAGQEYPGVGVGVIVEFPNGTIPLTLRGGTSNNRNDEWDLPGGTVELNDSLEETVVREVQEELGIRVRAKGCIRVDQDFVEGQHWLSFCYVAEYVGGNLENREPFKFKDVRLFDPNELPGNTSPLAKAVVESSLNGAHFIPIYNLNAQDIEGQP